MYKHGKTPYALLCGFALAGAAGTFGVAHADETMDGEKTRAEQVAEDVETFNQNRGSLKEQSAARSGAPTAHIDGNDDSMPATHAEHPRADELANEVRSFNRSGGSLNADSAADSHVNDDLNNSTPASHERADEVAKDVRDFNQSGGSLNRNSAADSHVNDDMPASQQNKDGSSPMAEELGEDVTEHNKNAD